MRKRIRIAHPDDRFLLVAGAGDERAFGLNRGSGEDVEALAWLDNLARTHAFKIASIVSRETTEAVLKTAEAAKEVVLDSLTVFGAQRQTRYIVDHGGRRFVATERKGLQQTENLGWGDLPRGARRLPPDKIPDFIKKGIRLWRA